MSIVKIAAEKVVNYYHVTVQPKEQSGLGIQPGMINQGKTFGKKDAAALAVGASTAFGVGELMKKKFPQELLHHRYAGKLGQAFGGTLGAVATYKALNRKKKDVVNAA